MYIGLEELLNIRTSRRFIAGRLTSDMETKLNFLTSKVSIFVIVKTKFSLDVPGIPGYLVLQD